MIEDLSANAGQKGSFTDLTTGGVTAHSSSTTDKALIVYQNTDVGNGESTTNQLLAKARIVLPAVMNYLFFSTAQVAVVYFGKKNLPGGRKIGEKEGMEDFKIRMIRFLTSEIWPPLLRTDAPDDSLGADVLGDQSINPSESAGKFMPSDSPQRVDEELRQLAEERSWFIKSIQNNMQVLLYLKRGVENTRYMKLILTNSQQRLHFDVIDTREEKFRWDLRMLYTRIMDNLETQKAIDSYDSYIKLFRYACVMASRHAVELERPFQSMTKVTFIPAEPEQTRRDFLSCTLDSVDGNSAEDGLRQQSSALEESGFSALDDGPSVSRVLELTNLTKRDLRLMQTPSPPPVRSAVSTEPEARSYTWMESLNKPESATLDYKSYFSHTSVEIRHRCVKFMCGFLNAYRQGKLIIGVHEMPRRDPDGAIITEKEGRAIVQHNDLINQYVVGVRVTPREMVDIQQDVSRQLLECIPPIPPQTVHFDIVPVIFSKNLAYSRRILILYDCTNTNSRDSIKQKSNYAIRVLNPFGLSIIPLDMMDQELATWVESDFTSLSSGNGNGSGNMMSNDDDSTADVNSGTEFKVHCLKAEAFAIAAVDDPKALETVKWEAELKKALRDRTRGRCHHFFFDYPEKELGTLEIPPLNVIEISVDINQCGFEPLKRYQGKFFTGWPSIPIWDTTTKTVRRVERNYNVFKSAHPNAAINQGNESFAFTMQSGEPTTRIDSRKPAQDTFHNQLIASKWTWYSNPQIVNRVLVYLYDRNRMSQILNFRLIHPVCNEVFENKQGIYLINMLSSTPFGVPVFTIDASHLSRMQYAFLHSGVPPLPLLLCRIYELIGNLPSPYPYLSVPLTQQNFRVAAFLIPLFYRQHYFDGQMRHAVVLDLRDGYLKTITLKDGNLLLESIVVMGFEPLNRRQVTAQLALDDGNGIGMTNIGNSAITKIGKKSLFETAASPDVTELDLRPSFVSRRSVLERSSSVFMLGDFSQRGSTMVSPKMSETTLRQTPRETEPDIPNIHYKFFTQKDLQAAGFSAVNEEALPFCGTNKDPRWTLQHLLEWYNALFTDEVHFGFFGYCNRSIAFHVESLSEVCQECVEKGALYLLNHHMEQQEERCAKEANIERTVGGGNHNENCTPRCKQRGCGLAECREHCILHKRVKEWLDV